MKIFATAWFPFGVGRSIPRMIAMHRSQSVTTELASVSAMPPDVASAIAGNAESVSHVQKAPTYGVASPAMRTRRV